MAQDEAQTHEVQKLAHEFGLEAGTRSCRSRQNKTQGARGSSEGGGTEVEEEVSGGGGSKEEGVVEGECFTEEGLSAALETVTGSREQRDSVFLSRDSLDAVASSLSKEGQGEVGTKAGTHEQGRGLSSVMFGQEGKAKRGEKKAGWEKVWGDVGGVQRFPCMKTWLIAKGHGDIAKTPKPDWTLAMRNECVSLPPTEP